MVCPSCRREIPDNAVFCPHCGESVPVKPAAPTKPARRRRVGCWLIGFVILLGVVVVLVGSWWLIGRRILTNWLLEQYTPMMTSSMRFDALQGHVYQETFTAEMINDTLDDTLPVDMGPIEDVQINLLRDVIVVRLQVYGLETSLQAKAKDRGGGLSLSQVHADGILNWVVVPQMIADYVEKQVNDDLQKNNILLRDLQVSPQGVTVRTEPR